MQMRWIVCVPLACLASCVTSVSRHQLSQDVAAPQPPREPAVRTLSAHIGEREVRDFKDSDTDDQFVGGADFVYQPPHSPLAVEAGLFFTGDTEDDVNLAPSSGASNVDEISLAIGELYAGLRLTGSRQRIISPYLAFGVSIQSVSEHTERVNGSDEDDDDTTIGAYGRVGFIVPIEPVVIGVDFRIVRLTDVDLASDVAGQRINDLDSEQVTIFVGWRF